MTKIINTPSSDPKAKPAHKRDHRVDALRGIALTMMFVDHIPDNLLNLFTMRNIGFADAAEIFVILAGYASWLAYGRGILKNGMPATLKRLAKRCLTLYSYQICMAISSVIIILQWRKYNPVPVDFLEPELAYGYGSWWRVIFLDALPSNLNILPLYIVLLASFPFVYFLLKISPWLVLTVSGGLWLFINHNPNINFPNWLDPDGWYFDPLAWQFLFVLGVVAAFYAYKRGGSFPFSYILASVCVIYLLFSLIQAFPWQYWGLRDMRLFVLHPPSKTSLSPFRLLDVLAIFYLVQSSEWAKKLAESKPGQVLALYGRHSLEVFSVGTMLDLLGRLLFVTLGNHWFLQVLVNIVGLGLLYLLAWWLDRTRRAAKSRKISS